MDKPNNVTSIINLSFFGPSDHGKSTLIGYLFSKYKPDEFSRYQESLQRKLGNFYQLNRMYAYVSDRHYTEQVGIPGEKDQGIGTTQHVHSIEINIDGQLIHFIDNPGQYKWRKETVKGLIRGEYGVFVIDINAMKNSIEAFQLMTEQNTLNYVPPEVREYILPLYIALKLGMRLAFIVLSKMDLAGYNENDFKVCSETIKSFISKHFNEIDKDIPIIPTSIIYSDKIDHNVFSKSKEVVWHKGRTFIDLIKILSSTEKEIAQHFFFPVQTIYPKIPGHRLVVTGKVYEGVVRPGDRIKIAPFEKEKKYSVDGRIRSIHLDLTEKKEPAPLKEAIAGNVVGLSLNLENKFVDYMKSKRNIPYIAYSEDANVCFGNIVCFEIPEYKLSQKLLTYNPLSVSILINGKYILSTFIGLLESISEPVVYCFHLSRIIGAVKSTDGQIELSPLILIEQQAKKLSDTYLFPARVPIRKLGFLESIAFSFPRIMHENGTVKMTERDMKNYAKIDNDTVKISINGDAYKQDKKIAYRIANIIDLMEERCPINPVIRVCQ